MVHHQDTVVHLPAKDEGPSHVAEACRAPAVEDEEPLGLGEMLPEPSTETKISAPSPTPATSNCAQLLTAPNPSAILGPATAKAFYGPQKRTFRVRRVTCKSEKLFEIWLSSSN